MTNKPTLIRRVTLKVEYKDGFISEWFYYKPKSIKRIEPHLMNFKEEAVPSDRSEYSLPPSGTVINSYPEAERTALANHGKR
jgi:hypothetical protein